jgi:FKBP-type peptidyl-prolyl cis-trans isomerase
MKIILWVVVSTSLIISGCQKHDQKLSPKTIEDKYAYSVGADMARMQKHTLDRITEVEENFNLDMYLQGLTDAINDQLQLDEDTIKQVSGDFQKRFVAMHKAKRERETAENKAAAEKFFAENKNQEGIVETESGLQYKIIQQGSGKQPAEDDMVKVHYRGTLLKGTEFDNSYARGEPAEFQLRRVVRGWTEGLQLMKEGGKFMFYVPPELGYGERGRPNIPSNSTLIFEVELISVLDKKTTETK